MFTSRATAHLIFTLLFAAAMAMVAWVTVATAEGQKKVQPLDASKSGIEAIDKNRVPQAVKDAIASLRDYTAEQKDDAVEAAQRVLDEIRKEADAAAQRLENAADATKDEALEAKQALDALMAEAEARLGDMQQAALETWNATRDAVAEALEKAAAQVDSKN